MEEYIKKNGLLLSEDSSKVISVENDSVVEVKIPAEITDLPPFLFEGCKSLTKIQMPNQLNGFPEGLFKDCTSLKEIPFRAGIKNLPDSVFENCSSLKSIVIPDTVKTIGSKAFAGCSALESIVLPGGIYDIAIDAFDGCASIHNIRINGDGGLIYMGEEDGNLYFAADEGDRIAINVYGVQNQGVGFFSDNVDDEPIAPDEDDEFEDDDTFFSAEIGASDEEFNIGETKMEENVENVINPSENNVDSVLSEIMGAQKERYSDVEDVSVSDSESEVLSGAMEVMSDEKTVHDAYVSNDEMIGLFEKSEDEERKSRKSEENIQRILDSKTKILVDAAKLSRIDEFTPVETPADDPVLYVVAEKVIKDADGNDSFTPKLLNCCEKFARIHDFNKVIYLYGLPIENDEFMQFYHQFIAKKNIILACEAENVSNLSEYGHVICEQSRISLEQEDLREQKKNASHKTNMLIKLVIRDKYE